MLRRAETTPDTDTTGQRPTGRLRSLAARLDRDDRAALGYWAAAHAALLILGYAAAWIGGNGKDHQPFTGVYERWDAVLYRSIAQYGYWGGPGGTTAHPNQEAFFPGYPAALAAAHLLVRNWTLAELALSLTAGCVAAVALARLAGSARAALYLTTAPAAVFLTVGYSESLFLAFAVPAWLAVRDRRWALAGGLGYFAAFTRVTGLFLIPALLLAALLSGRGRWKAAAQVLPAAAAPAVFEVFLYVHTHRWSAWLDANRAGWGVHLAGPWATLRTAYGMAFGHGLNADYGLMSQVEIASVVAMLALTVVLLARRQWPQAVYVGLGVAALATASYYQACARGMLVCFPLYVLLARASQRRPWVGGAWLAVSGPLAVVVAVQYLRGSWAG